MSPLFFLFLNRGKFSIGLNKAYVGMDSSETLITSKDNPLIYEEEGTLPPYENLVADADTLEGHPASYFAIADHTHDDRYYTESEIDSKLSNKSDSTHKHSANDITSGTLPLIRGGTGITNNPSCLINLASTTAASLFTASPRPGVTGILPLDNGGTGVSNLSALKDLLGITSISGLTCVDSETGNTNYDVTAYTLPSRFLDYMLIYYMIYFSKTNVSTQQTTPYLHHGIIMPNAIKTLKYYADYNRDVYVYNDDFTIISFKTNGDFDSIYWKYSSSSTIYIFGYN